MDNYCAFSKDHKCLKWMDYELTRHELEEADALFHGNWIEIQQLYKKIHTLETLLKDAALKFRIHILINFYQSSRRLIIS